MVEHHLQVHRTARYFTRGPAGCEGATAVVWYLLHGYGQLARAFIDLFATVDDGERLLVAPEALNRFYLEPPSSGSAASRTVGATWMTREDREAEILDYVAYLDAVHLEVSRRLEPATPAAATGTATTDRRRTVVLGFSQGAATATRWVVSSANRFDALVLWGGLFPPEVDVEAFARSSRMPPVSLVAGTQDTFIAPEAFEQQVESFQRHAVQHRVWRFEGGHVLRGATLRDVVASVEA